MTASPVRVLGVDPGTFRTGWGLIGGSLACPSLLGCGVIRLPQRAPLPDRLARLKVELELLLSRLDPTAAAVEAPFHGANARAALQLAHARGVVFAVLAAAAIPVAEYAPSTIKKAVTGNGRADKAQVQSMVRRLLRLDAVPGGFDREDALAVALCHAGAVGLAAAVLTARGSRRSAKPSVTPAKAGVRDRGPGFRLRPE